MSAQIWDYVVVFAAALAGVLARVGQWRKADNTFDGVKALGECMAVPAIAFIVSGGMAQFFPEADVRAVAAVSALAGIVGVAGIEQFTIRYINRKIDG